MKSNNTFSRGYIESMIFWLLSPLLSIFVFLLNIYKKDKKALLGFSLVLGTLSFIYIPLDNDDRIRHYERFYEIGALDSFQEFSNYLLSNSLPDSLVYGVMYLLHFFTNDPRWVFFIASSFTSYIFLFVYISINKDIFKCSRFTFLLCFCLVICSLNYGHLFSGLRFYVGVAFSLLGWYYLFYKKSKINAVIFLVFAIYSHFGTSLIVVSFVLLYFSYKRINYRKVFYISFLFTLIPNDLLFSWISMLPLAGSYINKASDYLMYNDMMSTAAETAFTFRMILLYKSLWAYFIMLFVFIYRKTYFSDKKLINTVFIIVALRNVFSGSPTISQYYDTIALFLSVLFMIKFYLENINKLFYVFAIYIFGSIFLDTYKYRHNFVESNFRIENVTSASIYGSDVKEPLKTTWE